MPDELLRRFQQLLHQVGFHRASVLEFFCCGSYLLYLERSLSETLEFVDYLLVTSQEDADFCGRSVEGAVVDLLAFLDANVGRKLGDDF